MAFSRFEALVCLSLAFFAIAGNFLVVEGAQDQKAGQQADLKNLGKISVKVTGWVPNDSLGENNVFACQQRTITARHSNSQGNSGGCEDTDQCVVEINAQCQTRVWAKRRCPHDRNAASWSDWEYPVPRGKATTSGECVLETSWFEGEAEQEGGDQEADEADEATVTLAPANNCPSECEKPSGWCSAAGEKYEQDFDMDRDGVKDHTCVDNYGYFGSILSSKCCFEGWTKIPGWKPPTAGAEDEK